MKMLAVFRAAVAEVLANRRALVVGVTTMVINDIAWILFWKLFFGRVGVIKGWHVDDVVLLFAISTTVVGLGIGFADNCRRIGAYIANGDLDEVLTLPIHPLKFLLFRRINVFTMGDLLFGLVVFFLGEVTLERFVVYVAASIAGATVLVCFLATIGSLTFFLGGRGTQSDLGFHAVIVLASYPMDLFGGITKVLMFTALPAAFITGIPRELVNEFTVTNAAILIAATLFAVIMMITVFNIGLTKYRSGSTWRTIA